MRSMLHTTLALTSLCCEMFQTWSGDVGVPGAGETVFIVGRTGSGKSTLLSVLLRMIKSSYGTIEIDERDIKSLGVSTLRRGVQVIPQDPFVFSGTIRSCLDFDSKHEDDALWHALDLVGLKKFVASQESKLDTVVEDNWSHYSVGLRQLLCLAAAILRNPKILFLDEATASIDAGADMFIQLAMRRSCPHAPTERQNSARELLARPNSMFSKLMAATRNNH
ncbi:P-loop containing nucleoside triphosphate hydrolase protein [Boletus reticuloceps]|uniref:P-loop containing nucleoside triphosphate hydrolase protein n=1 Tax=Boletus reticuloceps TaxID=495285 RepID=A0A8I3AG91_9AGAM|nr:P-loop containing nucleoside triphosphate hydrolase protein [Boletus reticuloceps]